VRLAIGLRSATRLTVVLTLLAACGKSGPDRAALCTSAAHDSITALITTAHANAVEASLAPAERAAVEARNKNLEAIAPRYEATLKNHCIDDKWPAASIDCYRKATSFDAMRACRDALPADAQTKLQTAELDLLGGGAQSSSPPGFAPEPPHAPLTKAEHDAAVADANARAAQMKELGAKINDASQKLAAASAADRPAAKAELDALTKQADELRAKLAAAQAKATGTLSSPTKGDTVTAYSIVQIKPLDASIDEEWGREIAEPRMRDIHGVSATKVGRQKWPWSVTVAIMEFVRDTPLEATLRKRIITALRAVPGVTEAAEDDRERWVVRGNPSGKALVEAVAVVVDELAPQTSIEYDE
jgi:hypothetical protein